MGDDPRPLAIPQKQGYSRKVRFFTFLVLALTLLGGTTASALEFLGLDFNGLEIQGGLGYVFNSVQNSAPDPILALAGFSLPLKFPNSLVFRPEFQFSTNTYAFQDGRAIFIESMFDSVMLLSIGFFPWLGQEFDLTEVLTLGYDATLGFLFRFPIFFYGKGANYAVDVTSWYLAGRFLYPSGSGYLTWKFSELFRLTVRLQLLLPLFNLWTPTALWDQLQTNLLVGVRWDF